MSGKREYGDYQTPDSFALSVCEYLKEKRGINPAVVIEPTCGTGSFIKNSLIFNADCIIGIDVNKDYCEECKNRINDSRVQILNADFFSIDLTDRVLFVTHAGYPCYWQSSMGHK